MSCPQHLNQKITTICKVPTCNEPLCSQCMVAHTQFHNENNTKPDIQSITAVRAEALLYVNGLISNHISLSQFEF